MKELEYADVDRIVDFISNNDVYNMEKFLFSPDVDIVNTGEVSLRNSFFNYTMVGYYEENSEDEGKIKNISIFKFDQQQRQNGVLKLELIEHDEAFIKNVLNEIVKTSEEEYIAKAKISLLRRQLDPRTLELLKRCNFEEECVYRAKDDDTERDTIVLNYKISR